MRLRTQVETNFRNVQKDLSDVEEQWESLEEDWWHPDVRKRAKARQVQVLGDLLTSRQTLLDRILHDSKDRSEQFLWQCLVDSGIELNYKPPTEQITSAHVSSASTSQQTSSNRRSDDRGKSSDPILPRELPISRASENQFDKKKLDRLGLSFKKRFQTRLSDRRSFKSFTSKCRPITTDITDKALCSFCSKFLNPRYTYSWDADAAVRFCSICAPDHFLENYRVQCDFLDARGGRLGDNWDFSLPSHVHHFMFKSHAEFFSDPRNQQRWMEEYNLPEPQPDTSPSPAKSINEREPTPEHIIPLLSERPQPYLHRCKKEQITIVDEFGRREVEIIFRDSDGLLEFMEPNGEYQEMYENQVWAMEYRAMSEHERLDLRKRNKRPYDRKDSTRHQPQQKRSRSPEFEPRRQRPHPSKDETQPSPPSKNVRRQFPPESNHRHNAERLPYEDRRPGHREPRNDRRSRSSSGAKRLQNRQMDEEEIPRRGAGRQAVSGERFSSSRGAGMQAVSGERVSSSRGRGRQAVSGERVPSPRASERAPHRLSPKQAVRGERINDAPPYPEERDPSPPQQARKKPSPPKQPSPVTDLPVQDDAYSDDDSYDRSDDSAPIINQKKPPARGPPPRINSPKQKKLKKANFLSALVEEDNAAPSEGEGKVEEARGGPRPECCKLKSQPMTRELIKDRIEVCLKISNSRDGWFTVNELRKLLMRACGPEQFMETKLHRAMVEMCHDRTLHQNSDEYVEDKRYQLVSGIRMSNQTMEQIVKDDRALAVKHAYQLFSDHKYYWWDAPTLQKSFFDYSPEDLCGCFKGISIDLKKMGVRNFRDLTFEDPTNVAGSEVSTADWKEKIIKLGKKLRGVQNPLKDLPWLWPLAQKARRANRIIDAMKNRIGTKKTRDRNKDWKFGVVTAKDYEINRHGEQEGTVYVRFFNQPSCRGNRKVYVEIVPKMNHIMEGDLIKFKIKKPKEKDGKLIKAGRTGGMWHAQSRLVIPAITGDNDNAEKVETIHFPYSYPSMEQCTLMGDAQSTEDMRSRRAKYAKGGFGKRDNGAADWLCPSCRFSNFGSRFKCHRCNAVKPPK